MKKEAKFYTQGNDDYIICKLCPHNCHLKDGQIGICGVREVKDNKLYTLNYGEISSINLDPIEKKPLYHYKPGSLVLSLGSFGCNFSCGFCQNHSISMGLPKTQVAEIEDLVNLAESTKNKGNIGVAFTYNEPSIWYEYVYDVAKKLKEKNLDVILVTNGYISKEPLEELLPLVDAMNIDLKAFNNDYYKKICGGRVEDVMETIKIASSKCHIEVTTLLVNGLNDSKEEVEKLATWLSSVDSDIPLHLSRYYPNYKLKEPPTPEKVMFEAVAVAKKHLNYIYLGNLGGVDNNTYCPNCKKNLVDRNGYKTDTLIHSSTCPKCGKNINITL